MSIQAEPSHDIRRQILRRLIKDERLARDTAVKQWRDLDYAEAMIAASYFFGAFDVMLKSNRHVAKLLKPLEEMLTEAVEHAKENKTNFTPSTVAQCS